jgi:multiple sugar transport system substrate-binding protein
LTLPVLLRSDPQELEAMTRALAPFEARYPQVTVEKVVATTPGPYNVKADALLAAGTPPALWFPAGGRGYRYYAARGQTEVLDDLIARDKYDLSDFSPAPLAFCKWSGRYSALPMFVVPFWLVWNEGLFRAAGVPAPPASWQERSWTWERFLEAARALTRRGAGPADSQFGAQLPTADDSELLHGGDFYDDAAYETGYPDPARFPADRAGVAEAWDYVHGLLYRSRVQPTDDEAAALRGTLPNAFLSGRLGLLRVSTSFLATAAPFRDVAWRPAPVPWPGRRPRRQTMNADQWVILRGQPSRDAAWELLKHMAAPAAQRLYAVDLGRLAARRSLAEAWVRAQREASGLAEGDLRIAVDAVGLSRIRPLHAVVHHERLVTEAIGPERARLFRNETSVGAALDAIVPPALAIVRETAPPRRAPG